MGTNYFASLLKRNFGDELEGRLEEAITEVAKATGYPNSEPWHHHRHGVLLATAKRLGEAETSLRLALKAEPDDARHRFVLSEILQRADKPIPALVEAARATRCPNAEPWHFHRYGVLLAARGILDQARASLAVAVQGDPNQWRSRVELVDLLERLGRADEAIGVAAAGIEAGCQEPRLLRQYGLLLARRGHFEEAKSALDSARRPGLKGLKHRLVAAWRYTALRARAARERGERSSTIADGQTVS
jgi:Flp pilus assembly protein TadD